MRDQPSITVDEEALARRVRAWYSYTKRELFRAERERNAQSGWRAAFRRYRRAIRRALLHKPRTWLREGQAIFSNLRSYGKAVEAEYGVPLTRQVAGMCYMTFRADIPMDGDIPIEDWHYVPVYPERSTHYYGYRLFVPERWEHVDEYTYYSWPVHPAVNHFYRPDTGLYGKLNFFQRCRDRGIPTPPVIASFEDGTATFHTNNGEGLPPTDIFVKPNSESGGHGADRYRFEAGSFVSTDGASYSAEALLERLRRNAQNGKLFLVQPYLSNHSEWASFSTGALITMRVVTGRTTDGRIEPLAACFRMPVGTMVVDNISSGGIVSPLDIKTGRLGTAVRKLPYDGIFGFDTHPDTKQALKGVEVPRWREALQFACEAHEAFETVFVGWDISLTSDGFVAVEGNLGWEARLMEVAEDTPLIRTRYAELYDEWMRRIA